MAIKSDARIGLHFLRGRTEYGDSIEDEWVIVWVLRQLTKTFPKLWIKVTDSDGEFLLIEASGTLPKWLEPEVAENRVWINDGQMKIIKPSGKSRSSKRTDETLTLEESHEILLSEPHRIMHSVSIEEEAFYRLRNYPGQISKNVHNALLRLPRKAAYLLRQKPAYVAPAVEAFYLRDPISLKPLRDAEITTKLRFEPNDLVELSVRFPKVAYAQLKCQNFPVLESWKSEMPPPTESEARSITETGMKLTIGFEILLSDSHYQDQPSVREMLLLLEDIDSGDVALPTDEELTKLGKNADDEKWLDINYNELQKELSFGKDRSNHSSVQKKPEFGDKTVQDNLQRIVKQFESFLNENDEDDKSEDLNDDDSEIDDLDDIDSDDLEEDKDASFNEDEFSKLMQEMMGMPPEVMQELRSGKIDALTNESAAVAPPVRSSKREDSTAEAFDLENENETESEELQDLMKRMDAELRDAGALDLGESSAGNSVKPIKGADLHEMEDSSEDDASTDDEKEQIAKHLLESLQAQGGASGPARNLMELMAEQYASEDKAKAVSGKGKKAN